MPTVRKTTPRISGPTRVTLKFFAEYLKLSPTTVSVVLTNSPLAKTIAGPTKDRIWEAVRKFQYRPNLFARYLHTKRTFSIAVLVPEIGDEFSAMLISGMESKLAEAKFSYFVESHRFAPQQIEDSPNTLMDRQVEGMIFLNTPLRQQMPVPVVAISDITNAPGVTRIVIDNDRTVFLGLRHLKELGHKRDRVLQRPRAQRRHRKPLARKLKGLRRAGTRGTAGPDCDHGELLRGGRKIHDAARIRRRHDAAADNRATLPRFLLSTTAPLSARSGPFRTSGLSVPGNISVVGMDDIQITAFISPRLTTIRQPLKHMGAIAASTLLQRIRG